MKKNNQKKQVNTHYLIKPKPFSVIHRIPINSRLTRYPKRLVALALSLALLNAPSVTTYAETIDDLRELSKQERVDSRYTDQEQIDIEYNYTKIERHNTVAEMLDIFNEIDVLEGIEEQREKLELLLKEERLNFYNSFMLGGKVEDLLQTKTKIATIEKEISLLKEEGDEITLEKKENIYKHDYDNIVKMLNEIENMEEIGSVGSEMASPVLGNFFLSGIFGIQRDPIENIYKRHEGVDLVGKEGMAILSAWNGKVVRVAHNEIDGKTIVIQHDKGLKTVYKHLKEVHIKEGQKVKQTDRIGSMGDTGKTTEVHLHFEIHLDGNPVDPIYFFGKQGVNALKSYMSTVSDQDFKDRREFMEGIKERPDHLDQLIKDNPSGDRLRIGEKEVDFDRSRRGNAPNIIDGVEVKRGHEMPKPSSQVIIEDKRKKEETETSNYEVWEEGFKRYGTFQNPIDPETDYGLTDEELDKELNNE